MNVKNSQYRVVLYDNDGVARYVYSERPAEDNEQALVRLLENKVYSGLATGGHIEERLPFAGKGSTWVVCLTAEEVWP